MERPSFEKELLLVDAEQEVEKITGYIRRCLGREIRRRGLVVAVSGGIDSSTCLALAVRAIGPERVFVLLMPERHSSGVTLSLSKSVVETFGAPYLHEDLSPILEAVGFYDKYDNAVRRVVPEYGAGWKSKITISSALEEGSYSRFSIVTRSPDGVTTTRLLPVEAYLEIVAATNFKQRTRKMLEYYHADRLNYAVTGTPNRLEYDQGFFVKLGDGAADIKPIAHLYKTQVYEIAKYLGVPAEVCSRPPTTDTYSLAQGQDEFYFSLDYARMDLCLYGLNYGYAAAEVAPAVNLSVAQTQRVYDDIVSKRAATRYLHQGAYLVSPVEELATT